jgi:drug/metabolite transporter (DMT)-like permease
MPAVFVVIWSTGFIVAKYGMPYAPPLTFLADALFPVHRLLSCLDRPGPRRLAHKPRAMGPPGRDGRTDACGLPGRRLGCREGRHGLGPDGAYRRPAARAHGAVGVLGFIRRRPGGASKVTARQWAGLALGLGGLLLVVSRKFGTGQEVTALTLACTVFSLFSITAGTLYQKRFVNLPTCAPPMSSSWRRLLW